MEKKWERLLENEVCYGTQLSLHSLDCIMEDTELVYFSIVPQCSTVLNGIK